MAAKTDVVVKLVLVFFISLLSFSVGTFVGKKYSDNQHQLSQLEPKNSHKNEHGAVAAHGEEVTEKKSGAMSDEEIAKLAEEFVGDETKPTEHGAGHGDAHAAADTGHGTAAHGDAHGDAHATATSGHGDSHAEPVAHGKTGDHASPQTSNAHAAPEKAVASTRGNSHDAPVAHDRKANTNDARVPTSLPKNVGQYNVGKFTVQVASYADEAEAQKTASELKEKGYSAFYVPANIKGKTWYRVSVGQFATMKEASSYKVDLMSKAKVSSAIVQKITE